MENMELAMTKCDHCDGIMRLASPQRGDMEAVLRCDSCSVLVILDSHPSAPQSFPADLVVFNRKAQGNEQLIELLMSPALMRWSGRERHALLAS